MPRIPLSTTIALLAIVISIFALALDADANTKSTRDGAFTVEQTERGKVVYERSCGNCHQADLPMRLARFENKSVAELYESVSTAMPADNPGGLLSSEYIDALAYIFSITGSPAGNEELTADNLDAIRVASAQ